MKSPLITIIVAVFNMASTLQRCIDSIVNQTYPHKELIIIDGGSTDGTVDILKSNNNNITYWESKPDRGIYHAWNKALDHAKGNWLYFLGADDYCWSADAIKQIVPHLSEAYPLHRVVYGQVALVTTKEEVLYLLGDLPWKKVRRRFLEEMCIPHPGVFHHKNLFECYGRFNEAFRIAGDFELLLRELKTQDAFFIPGITVAAHQVGGVSSNPYQSLRLLEEEHRARKLHGFIFPGRYWTLSFLKVCVRIMLWRIIGERSTRKILDLGRRILGNSPYWTRT